VTVSLGSCFRPRGVALIGLPGDVERPGGRPLRFLRRHGYAGAVYPVNPRHREIGGLPCYDSLAAVPGPVDVAWIGVPADRVLPAVEECGRAGVPFAVVLGGGFAETGVAGAATQAALQAAARAGGVRLIGPNTVGFVNAWDGVALTFSSVGELPTLSPGPVALLSQSGGLGGSLVNRLADAGGGVGLFVSAGNEADLGLADYLDWLVGDGRARAVACVIEQVRAPARFAAAVRRASQAGIPVLATKLGGSGAGARAARSHTGALVGRRDAWRAWARAIGLIEVAALEDLLDVARFLATTPPLGGTRAAMVTSSGGMAVTLADALEPEGFTFAPLGAATTRALASLLPGYAAIGNPVDITAGLPEPTFGDVLTAVMRDPDVDVLVVPLTMATAARGRTRAEQVVRAAGAVSKPVAVCWPGGSLVAEGLRVLDEAGVPLFRTVASCAAALGASRGFAARGPAPTGTPSGSPSRSEVAPLAASLPSGPLAWSATRGLLVDAGVTVADEVVVTGPGDTLDGALDRLGYPAVVKLLGPLHRTDVDGVRLGLADREAVRRAVRELLPRGEGCLVQPMLDGVEVLIGAVADPALGAFVMVAPGGIHAELYGERAMRPAPVDPAEAAAMLDECRALGALLSGYRGRPPADRAALAGAVAAVSRLAAGLGRRLLELDLNPVIVGPRGATAVDARIVLS
jgi:acyl-CoA synthetase (NDP forming)